MVNLTDELLPEVTASVSHSTNKNINIDKNKEIEFKYKINEKKAKTLYRDYISIFVDDFKYNYKELLNYYTKYLQVVDEYQNYYNEIMIPLFSKYDELECCVFGNEYLCKHLKKSIEEHKHCRSKILQIPSSPYFYINIREAKGILKFLEKMYELDKFKSNKEISNFINKYSYSIRNHK